MSNWEVHIQNEIIKTYEADFGPLEAGTCLCLLECGTIHITVTELHKPIEKFIELFNEGRAFYKDRETCTGIVVNK
jgi:hypothetical protein